MRDFKESNETILSMPWSRTIKIYLRYKNMHTIKLKALRFGSWCLSLALFLLSPHPSTVHGFDGSSVFFFALTKAMLTLLRSFLWKRKWREQKRKNLFVCMFKGKHSPWGTQAQESIFACWEYSYFFCLTFFFEKKSIFFFIIRSLFRHIKRKWNYCVPCRTQATTTATLTKGTFGCLH